MINRRLGLVFISLAVLVGVVLFFFISTLHAEGEQLGCFGDAVCGKIDTSLNVMHFAFGIVGFILALGVYLLFFYSGEQAILKRLEDEKERKLSDDTHSIMMRAMDKHEKNIFSAIKEQNGISQSTLVLRSGLSKAKVSEVLSGFEKKNLVRKEKKGKVNHIFLVDV